MCILKEANIEYLKVVWAECIGTRMLSLMDYYLAHCTHLEYVFHASGLQSGPTQATCIHTQHVYTQVYTRTTHWSDPETYSQNELVCLSDTRMPDPLTSPPRHYSIQWCNQSSMMQVTTTCSAFACCWQNVKFTYIKAVFMVTSCESYTNLRVHVVQSSDLGRLKKHLH